MNAYALVTAAQNWTVVPEARVCQAKPSPILYRTLTYGETVVVRFHVDGCTVDDGRELSFLEHVQIETSIQYTRRGALQMRLTSPSGTGIQILNPRKLDDSIEGFSKWRFMSVATWGEDPRGTWILEISDLVGPESNNGTIEDMTLILHGTNESPRYRKNGPRIYNEEYNRIRKMNDLKPPDDVDLGNDWRTTENNEESDGILGIKWLTRFLLG